MGGFDLAWLFLERLRLLGSQVLCFQVFVLCCGGSLCLALFWVFFNRINFFWKMLFWQNENLGGEVHLDEVFNGNIYTT